MLLYSDNESDWTAIRLAKELGVKPPTMTGILDTLEKTILYKEHHRKKIEESFEFH